MREDTARWRVLIPVSVVLAWLQFAFRNMQGGMWLPDFGLILLFWAIPPQGSRNWRFPFLFVFWLGAVRSGITVLDPLYSWLGFALALVFRNQLFKHFSHHSGLLRFGMGALSAVPPALMDLLGSYQLGDPLPANILIVRCLWVAGIWSWMARPVKKAFG